MEQKGKYCTWNKIKLYTTKIVKNFEIKFQQIDVKNIYFIRIKGEKYGIKVYVYVQHKRRV